MVKIRRYEGAIGGSDNGRFIALLISLEVCRFVGAMKFKCLSCRYTISNCEMLETTIWPHIRKCGPTN